MNRSMLWSVCSCACVRACVQCACLLARVPVALLCHRTHIDLQVGDPGSQPGSMANLEHGVGARRFEVFRLEAARRRRAVSTSGGPRCRKGSSKGAAELAAGGLKKSEAARTTRARFRTRSSMRSWRRPCSRLTSKSGLRRRPESPGHAVGKQW